MEKKTIKFSKIGKKDNKIFHLCWGDRNTSSAPLACWHQTFRLRPRYRNGKRDDVGVKKSAENGSKGIICETDFTKSS